MLGRWTYALLLRRRWLSILGAVYEFALREPGSKFSVLPRLVRSGLGISLDLFPIVFSELRRPFAPVMYASDACLLVSGVTYATMVSPGKSGLVPFQETHVMKGWHTMALRTTGASSREDDMTCVIPKSVSANFEKAVAERNWRVAISTAWKTRGHINILELESALLAATHMGRSFTARGCQVGILVDSTAALGAMAKGRSSSTSLNRISRRLAATFLASDV